MPITFGSFTDDNITATDGDDFILTFKGDDVVFAGDGDDFIITGKGDDIVYAGGGDDFIVAGSGNDIVYGGDGDDIGLGGRGDDNLYGEAGDDILLAGSGDDTLNGGAGNDILIGGSGFDTVNVEGSIFDYDISSSRRLTRVNELDENGAVVSTDYLSRVEAMHFEAEDYTLYLDGRDNAVLITGDDTGSVTEDALTPATGTLIANDFDGTDGIVAVSAETQSTGGFGTYTIDAAGNWTYTVDDANATVNAMNAGDVMTDSFDVMADDGTMHTVTIDINGANDDATFAGDLSGSVNENDGVATGGTATIADVDAGQGSIVAASGASAYGTYSIGTDGVWTYSLDDANPVVDALAAGDPLTDSFVITSDDGTEQTIEIAITGADDYTPPETFGVTFNGAEGGDRSGIYVSSAGDVNGDGVDDLMIGAYGAGYDYTGAAHIVYGSETPFDATFDLGSLDGTNGFTFQGLNQRDYTGGHVSSAGDVNGDGYDDVIIGAYGSDVTASNAGQSFVVFGSAAPFAASFDPTDLDGVNGFAINGALTSDIAGIRVSDAGDVNNDGFDDVIIGAYGADPNGSKSGTSYVVYGSDAPFDPSIDLASLDGSNGFAINGIGFEDLSGSFVSSAGDINGDGIDDIMIGALLADPNGASAAGETYVVFGSDTPFAASIEVSDLDGTNGFTLNGVNANDQSGGSLAAAGDINGDGFDDILIGAFRGDPNGTDSGEAYVVFGSDTPFDNSMDLSSLDGSNGFVINGVNANDQSGYSVSSAGDANGDGFDDILIGAFGADPSGTFSGETYLVYGSDTPFSASLDLSSLDGSDGFVFNGIDANDRSGYRISGAGDVNNDGFDDMLIGAYLADANGVNETGESYLVYGGAAVLTAFDAADGVSDGSIQLSNLALAPEDFIV